MNHPSQPLVSVICVSYNHAAYVGEAIASVLAQTYPHVELIVIDDGSSDASVPAIKQALAGKKNIKFMALQENVGNCRAFNLAWRQAQGSYIIDLAADDRLLPGRIASGVAALQAAGPEYGLHFCDARIIDQAGRKIREHRTAEFFDGEVPQGYLFATVLRKYFINPVTMMYSRAMLDTTRGVGRKENCKGLPRQHTVPAAQRHVAQHFAGVPQGLWLMPSACRLCSFADKAAL